MNFLNSVICPSLALIVFTFVSCQQTWAMSCAELTNGSKNTITSKIPIPNQKITLTNSEKIKIRKDSENGYYQNALKFAEQWGDHFAELVFSNVKPNENTKIAIAMGGAEYLGHYLKAVAKKKGIKNIEFIELYLTTSVVGPWTAKGTENGQNKIRLKGIGEVPKGFEVYSKPSETRNNDSDLIEYIVDSKLFENTDNVIIVDTGYDGTMAEVINYAAKNYQFNGEVMGALLEHNGPNSVKNNLPIVSLNKEITHDNNTTEYTTNWWAHIIDEGRALGDRYGINYGFGFQRSRPSPSNLIKNADGQWVPNTKTYTDSTNVFKFQSMLLGIEDAVFGH